MKKTYLNYVSSLVWIFAVLLLVSGFVSVKAATPFFQKEQITVYIGKTAALDLENASNEITWRSEDEAIAIVDDDGIITPVSVGTTRIFATYKNVDYSCKVKVKQPHLDKTEVEVFPFEYFDVSISGVKVKKWEISDDTVLAPKYMRVSTFRLRALKEGEAYFNILGKDKQNYSCHVIVKPCTYKATYYDKKHKKLKNIGYYVDGRLEQYDAYTKGSGLKYSLKYVYEEDCYTEYKLDQKGNLSKTIYDYEDKVIGEASYMPGASWKTGDENIYYSWHYVFETDQYIKYEEGINGLISKTVYDYHDKVIRETTYASGATYETAEDRMISDKHFDEDGTWHVIRYQYKNLGESDELYLSEELFYNQDMKLIKRIQYFEGNGKRIENHYDLSGQLVREVYFDENNNIVFDNHLI